MLMIYFIILYNTWQK